MPVPVSRVPFILDGFLFASLPGAAIAFEGLPFDPQGRGVWVRPRCLPGDIVDGEKGGEGVSRRIGLYLIDVFAPAGSLPGDAWDLAARIEALFRRRCLDGVQTEDPRTSNMGADQYGAFRVRVSVPFWCWAAREPSAPAMTGGQEDA